MKSLTSIALFVTLIGVQAAIAQTATPAPKSTAPATSPAPTNKAMPAPKMDASAKAAKSKSCSMQADQKGLHGKERKTFREACKKS